MEKRIILAVALSILVMFFYSLYIEKFYPKAIHRETKIEKIERALETKPQSPITPSTPVKAKKDFLENEDLKIFINSIGGSIEEVLFKDRELGDHKIINEALFEKGLFSLSTNAIENASHLDYEIRRLENEMVLLNRSEDLEIKKRLSFLDKRFGILLEISFRNPKDLPFDLSYKINLGSKPSEPQPQRGFSEIAILVPGKIIRTPVYNLRNSKYLYQKDLEWIAIKERFFSLVTKPQEVPVLNIEISDNSLNNAVFLNTENFTILPGQEIIHRYILYAGPASFDTLKEFGYNFEKSITLGMFSGIAQILLTILNLFYKIFKNYGVSIILLSLSINLFLFPLSLKSIKSMKQLQQLQPHINKLREEFKDNPQRLNKELMELYKRYKVNPFGGCFPMLLQMPVFFALYQALMRSGELRAQRFLWIKDLSAPDVVFKLKFRIPLLGDSLNLLPILMIFAMFFQQKLSGFGVSAEQTEQQKILSFMMPLMLGIIFYNLPSGLVLYWLTSTILSSLLQFAGIRKF